LWVAVVVGVCVLAQALAPSRALASARAHVAVLSHGSWSWFADPRAVQLGNKVFVGWIDWRGEIKVGAYDPNFGTLGTYTLAYLFHDDHGDPSILVEPDDRLTVFWSAHNGSHMYYRTTRRPADIRRWGPVRHVVSHLPGILGFTYPNPVLLPDEGNKLYLFWRGSDWSQEYATRTANGQWRSAHRVIALPGQRPYMKVDSDGRDTIGLAFTNGHPREQITSIFYAAYRHGSLWHANGRWISRLDHAPIAPQQGDLVYNGGATHVASWVWDVAFDRRQRPVIVYATFPSTQNHAYWYAAFDGRRWVSHFLTFAGPTISPTTIEQQYSAGITLDHSNPSIVYLSKRVGDRFEIERWATPNGGSSWRHEIVVRDGSDNVRPVVPRHPRGTHTGLLWLVGYYGSYTNYRTSVAYMR
jgi:BNR repeat-containing family member